MSARVLHLPKTAAGRAELRNALGLGGGAEFRMYLVEEFDWDGSAIEMVRFGLAHYAPESMREARHG